MNQSLPVRRQRGRPQAGGDAVGAEELIVQTCEFLKSRPIADVTWAALGEQAGVSGKLFAYYFGQKEDLLVAILDRLMSELQLRYAERLGADERSPTDALRLGIRVLLGFYRDYPFFLSLVEHLNKAGHEQAIDVLRTRSTNDIGRFSQLLAAGHDREGWREVDASYLFTIIIGACGFFAAGPAALRFSRQGRADTPSDDEFADFLASVILGGLKDAPKR